MDGHTKCIKSGGERQVIYSITHMWNLKKKDTNELISSYCSTICCKTILSSLIGLGTLAKDLTVQSEVT